MRMPVRATVPARIPWTAARGTRRRKSEQRTPAKAIAAAIVSSAVELPPLGCGRASERATRPAPAISSAAAARTSAPPVFARLTRFWGGAMPGHRQTPLFPLAADHLELAHQAVVLVVEHVAVDDEFPGVV